MKLTTLEKKRTSILEQIQTLGDMRNGSLSVRYQRCGKSPCVCDDPAHPGHGPIYSYSSQVNGKTKICNYKPGAELDKLQREIETYQLFKQLTREFIELNNQICQMRPVLEHEDTFDLEALKKKLQKQSGMKSKRKSST